MPLQFSPETKQRFDALVTRYPQKKAALLPALWMAQEEFGGWLSPVGFLPDSFLWLLLKTFCVVSMFLWVRSTFPRYRYDQIMRLGWKIFIPVTLVWLVLIGAWMQTPYNIFK